MRLTLACLFFVLSMVNTIAQTTGGTPDATAITPANPDKGTARITGYIVDSTLAGAVDYANIALYNISTGKLVDGTVADAKGRFVLNRLAPGSYRATLNSYMASYSATATKTNGTGVAISWYLIR